MKIIYFLKNYKSKIFIQACQKIPDTSLKMNDG